MAKAAWYAGLGGGLLGAVAGVGILMMAGPAMLGERLVRDTMTAHPDILVDAADALRDQQYAPLIESNRALLETPYGSSWDGAKEPEVVLVEFYDYACGFCRQAKPDIDKLVAEDEGLRVVYRELPVLGPDSVIAAKASLAASKAGRFHDFHEALWALGRPNEENITQALTKVGLDLKAIEDPAFDAEIERNYELAGLLGATGTPLFVIGNRVINSADGYQAYSDAVAAARRAREG
ncbi:DsbA family protein [Sphingomicrobium nitratireducens]|uniref:DsbA family protein n=1 Tax=Sphingomicrobium nitratireducens TaxID=2964666 RepID=UPI00223EF909|nr:DsbA family protein [Sphingomicrobium nitratireducens]